MVLQTSGAISLLDIAGEFGGSAPHSLSEYYGKDGVVSSGAISIGAFYGKHNFLALWSGSSVHGGAVTGGFVNSGSSIRVRYGSSYATNWIAANTSGNFTNGASDYENEFTLSRITGFGNNQLLARYRTNNGTSNITFTKATRSFSGFSTTSGVSTGYGLSTSGGLIRVQSGYGNGAWVSLT